MNDNHPERPDVRTAEECERHAAEATVAAIRAASKVAEIGERDPVTAFSLIRMAAKFVQGATGDRARARDLSR